MAEETNQNPTATSASPQDKEMAEKLMEELKASGVKVDELVQTDSAEESKTETAEQVSTNNTTEDGGEKAAEPESAKNAESTEKVEGSSSPSELSTSSKSGGEIANTSNEISASTKEDLSTGDPEQDKELREIIASKSYWIIGINKKQLIWLFVILIIIAAVIVAWRLNYL